MGLKQYQIAEEVIHPVHGRILYAAPDPGDGFLRFYSPRFGGVVIVDPKSLEDDE